MPSPTMRSSLFAELISSEMRLLLEPQVEPSLSCGAGRSSRIRYARSPMPTRSRWKCMTTPPWRIHELVGDFQLLDVWALPTPGGPDDFPRLVEIVASSDTNSDSRAAQALWAIRWKLGEVFGWDEVDPNDLPGWEMLRDRLP